MWIVSNNVEYRQLEVVGIRVWGEDDSQHVAQLASELGDSAVEALCDAVIAGDQPEELLIELVDADDRYRRWMDRS
jgi:hypothetical protein